MNTDQLCRICLAHNNTRMYFAYEPLQNFYEKITGKSFKMDNGRLPVFCYICYHILKKCHRFAESAIKADEVLQQICKTEVQISKEYISVNRNPLLFMAFKNSPVTVVNIEEVSKVKSEEGRDSPDVDWTSSEQERIEATAIHEDDIMSDVFIKEEADLDVTGIEKDVLCSEDHHGSDTYGDDNEDVENGCVLAKFEEEEETCSPGVLEDILQLRHHHSLESDKDDLLDDIRLDETSTLGEDGLEKKDAIAKCCAVVLRRDERIERMLQKTQFPHCRRARTPGSKNRKLDHTIQYTDSLLARTSSRENTVAVKTSEIETNTSKGITEANVKCSDNGHKQLYRTRKTDCEKQNVQNNDKIRDNIKNASDHSHDFNESFKVQMCNKTRDEQKFICDYCGNEFTRRGLIRAHLKIHTNKLTCSDCGKKFSTQMHLKRHLMIHTCEKPFSCSYCGKKFTRLEHMKCHLRIHTGEKPYTCSDCGKKFSTQTNLKRHLRIHTDEKPFSCSHCGKKFTQLKTMKRHHLRTHTDEKPFTCSHCEKKFANKSDLVYHLRIYTGEKPFICSYCGKKFLYNSDMKRHLKSHTGEKPFTCSHCGKKFGQNSDLKRHLRSHTGEKPLNVIYAKKILLLKEH
ncbi:hypothetical protein ABMA27_012414 [Loxostege sticticalis]|uniref:Uncharacterized protein n=1 Tax=Loxostege sticticalis TaxID=481309 RepID=A0ABR3H173_LOXSC